MVKNVSEIWIKTKKKNIFSVDVFTQKLGILIAIK